jgi:hypothetical protein
MLPVFEGFEGGFVTATPRMRQTGKQLSVKTADQPGCKASDGSGFL